MLQLDSIVGLNLIQITIGGEKSDNLLLRELRSRFPVANISQIYASSELGYIFSVKDNLAGFPIQYLEKKFLRVNSHGELFVKRAGVWHGTGDLVRLVNDRYMFVGRVDSIVNIGGVKVDPSAVENIIRSLDGVLDALVTGVKNPILGAILVAEVIVTEDSGLSEIDLKNRLEVVLDRVQIPAVIKVVTAFSLNSNGKRRLSN
jgi:acyl-coenzyme A synthetase/AMP-(fatty) acid ligase